MKYFLTILLIASLTMGMLSGCSPTASEKKELQVFVASSLSSAMTEITAVYQKEHTDVSIILNADSSGKLLTQIEEGYECDIFFPAAQKQMDQLEQDGLIEENTRENVVNNRLVVLTGKGSGTRVTGLENLSEASSLALADGSVPAGRYTRQALMKLGILPKSQDVSMITTQEVSEALGGLEISEQGNVSKVLIALTEGACEVGTTYYSDTYGYEDKVEILEQVSDGLTDDIIYPICLVKNREAAPLQEEAAVEFYQFILSDTAKNIFNQHYFNTDVN